MKYTKYILGSLMLLSFSPDAPKPLTILSGPKQASQFEYVQDIVDVVGTAASIKLVNKKSNGASDNLNQLMDPKSPYKVAIVQADYLYYMQTQDMRQNTEKTKSVKVLLPLGYQQIHLVTKASKGFTGLKDIDGKVVSIGSSGQGTNTTATLIKERSEVWFKADITPFDDCFQSLNTDKIQAFWIVSPAPIHKLDVQPQSMVDKLALVPLTDFKDWAKYYKPDTIRKADYRWLDKDVPTFSVHSLLVVNEKKLTPEERTEVMKLRSAMQSNLEKLKKAGHAQWKDINFGDWDESNWPILK